MEFNFSVPAKVVFGKDSSKRVGEIVNSINCKKAFCVYDKGVKSAGIVDGIIKLIQEAGVEVVEYDGVLPNPPDTMVEEAAQIARNANVDVIVAIGGGSSIDSAKAINVLLSNPSPINQYAGPDNVNNPVKPLIAIPTTGGTSSEVTGATVVTDMKMKKKIVILGKHIGATYAIIDPMLTIGLPPAITAATGMDALTHAMESYISNRVSPVSDVHALKAIEIIYKNLPVAVKDGRNVEARTNIMLGCLFAGIAFHNAELGIVHGIAHPLSAHCGLAHGVANAAVLPYGMEYNADSVPERMKDMAKAMGLDVDGKTGMEAAGVLVEELIKLSKELGIPTLKGAGVDKEILVTIAEDTLLEGTMMFNRKKPTKDEVLAILEKAY